MSGAALVCAGAAVRAGGDPLLGPLDLGLTGRGITVVMGANGAGKSLFLRLAHGLIAPSAGTVLWSGKPARASMPDRGFVFQATPVLRRSVAANVAFPLQAQGLGAAAIRPRVAQALDRVRLGGRAGRPAAELSGGERQRMALARALVGAPAALLLDEPSASLDPASTADLEALIADVADQGVKVILSTHDIGQARRLATDVVFLAGGQLAEAGPADQFFAGPLTPEARAYLEGRL